MNKKLISLAVAAALAAPAAAMAEATLYGRLGASLDYEKITNQIPPTFATVPTGRDRGVENQTNVDGVVTITGAYDDGDGGTVPWELVTNQNLLEANGFTFNEDGTLTAASVAALANVPIIQLDANGRPIIGTPGQDFKGWGANQQGLLLGAGPSNRVGVKGSEDLGNGLKAIYQLELGVNFGDNNIPGGANGGISIRNSFVGLAGGFGTVLLGRHDTPLKISTGKLDLFSDTMADYNGTVGFEDLRTDNTVAYISPSFSGFSFMGAVVSSGGGTAGYGNNINSDQIAGAYSLAAIYNNGPFYASAAYESLNKEMFMNTEVSNAGQCDPLLLECSFVSDDYNKWRFGLGLLDWNGFTLTAIYENQDNVPEGQTLNTVALIDADGNISLGSNSNYDGQELWQVQAGYAFGNNMFKAMYGSVDRGDARLLNSTRDETIAINNLGGLTDALSNDLAGDKSTWAVGFDHNFSKRTQAYVLYTSVDDDNDDNILGNTASWEGFSIGMVHKF
jgi:predicted porin